MTSLHSEEYIKKQAVIFGRDPAKSSKLTTYHEKVNEAAKDLCLQNPELLSDRAKLLELSREKVHQEGYQYRKGTSRSKRLHYDSKQGTSKRPKISEDVRLRRISELEEDIKDATDQITIKEKRRNLASTSHQYKDCDRLTSQITMLRQKLREHRSELNQLQKKQCKSKWYKGKKRSSLEKSTPPPLSPTTSISSSPSPSPSSSSVSITPSPTLLMPSSGQFRTPPPPMMSPKHHGSHISLSSSPVTLSSPLTSPIPSSDSEFEDFTNFPYKDSSDTIILSSDEQDLPTANALVSNSPVDSGEDSIAHFR